MLASSQWVWLIISHQMVQISLLPPLTSSLASLKSLSPIFTLFPPLKCSGGPVCFCDWWRCRVSCSNYLVFSDIKDVQLRDQFSSLIFITKCCFNKNSRLPTRCCCSTLLWPSVGNISALLHSPPISPPPSASRLSNSPVLITQNPPRLADHI